MIPVASFQASFCIVARTGPNGWIILLHTSFPRQKQSAGGQAQLYVGGEAANNSQAKRAAKFGPSDSSSQEALSLDFSYKLRVTIT